MLAPCLQDSNFIIERVNLKARCRGKVSFWIHFMGLYLIKLWQRKVLNQTGKPKEKKYITNSGIILCSGLRYISGAEFGNEDIIRSCTDI